MTSFKHCFPLTLFLALFLMQNGEFSRIQDKLKLRKFGISFGHHPTRIEQAFALALKKFQEKLHLEQTKKHEQEIEKKRNEIFLKHLLSRVSGSVLNDFFTNRF